MGEVVPLRRVFAMQEANLPKRWPLASTTINFLNICGNNYYANILKILFQYHEDTPNNGKSQGNGNRVLGLDFYGCLNRVIVILIFKINFGYLLRQMNSRFFYGTMKEYLAKYRTKTREKRISLMNYLRTQRQRIVERERSKMVKRLVFWTIFLGGSFLIYDEVYRKKVQISKMTSKLNNFYSGIMVKEELKDDVNCVTVSPKTLDELANIISLAYRYHYKVIVRMDEVTKREKIIIAEKFINKCLFLNLSSLNTVKVDSINNTVYVEAGATCLKVNQTLVQQGYSPLFPEELSAESVYSVITNNLPLNGGQFNHFVTSLELVSASGRNFRSAGQTNRYGQIPSLTPLFVGTGGVFAVPTAANIKISKRPTQPLASQRFRINIDNVSEKVDALRKLNGVNTDVIGMSISNVSGGNIEQEMLVTCTERFPVFKERLDVCSTLCKKKGILIKEETGEKSNRKFNLFFSANNQIFEQFLLRFDKQLPYEFKDGLLKVSITQSQDHTHHQDYVQVITQVTNNNGVLVWCDIPEILLRIKPSLDSSEVGAQLMRKIVEVRQGLDHRNILYSHSRYQDYFAKGLFRKLTEYFW